MKINQKRHFLLANLSETSSHHQENKNDIKKNNPNDLTIMSCLQNTQALPAGGSTTLTAGLTGQLPRDSIMWQSYLPESHRIVTFDSSRQSPYEGGATAGACYKTPNGVCLGGPDAGVPWMTSSSAQMNAMKQMYTPYVGNVASMSSPGMAAMQLAASRGPSASGGACAYKFLDAMPL